MKQYIGRWLVRDDVNDEALSHQALIFSAISDDEALKCLEDLCRTFIEQKFSEGRVALNQLFAEAYCQLLADGPLESAYYYTWQSAGRPKSFRMFHKRPDDMGIGG